MWLNKIVTATVYVVNNGRVILHRHKKYNMLFSVGGHLEVNELPHEAAIREIYEESGLIVELYNEEGKLELGSVIQLPNPMSL